MSYPLVNWHNYGKTQFLPGKINLNPWPSYQRVNLPEAFPIFLGIPRTKQKASVAGGAAMGCSGSKTKVSSTATSQAMEG